ncbi:hypothetical protein HYPSUDRAFT_74980 [Hypholoma sublateritium FD-334 SS-4]|uniref:Uncharacterized protein n=1 Tax=Hypholoma sublateritium (strain FD-334 SS-4) TaxID=945553 RepID=A0A0D2PG46_HYPSF|nr:hypothetical protein HYPSUDRAFT_74980 [Hypholoma sublateritium FD-334 SS-4]
MSASLPFSFIIDDTLEEFFKFSSDLNISAPLSNLTGNYNKTATEGQIFRVVPEDADDPVFVEIIFNGTSVAVFGETATSDDGPLSENFTVTIDGGEPYMSTYDDPSPPSYRQWFQSPILSEGSHTIAFTNVLGSPSIDFAVINTTNAIHQQSVIVDDSNALISYTGAGWTTANTSFLLFQPPLTSKVVPYGNSSHLTAEVGDSFSFNFTGSELTVPGSLGVRFALDGGAPQDVEMTVDTAQVKSTDGQTQLNTPFFQSPSNTAPGSHNLVVEVTQAQNLSFIFDYITYVPSTSPAGTGTDDTSATPWMLRHKLHPTAIAASILGGLTFLLLAGYLYRCIRRRKQQSRNNFPYPFQNGVDSTSETGRMA